MAYSDQELESIRAGIGTELKKIDHIIENAESEMRDANYRKDKLLMRLEKMNEQERKVGE